MRDDPGDQADAARRSDAARNRARLIAAAREVFAHTGTTWRWRRSLARPT
ncbi:hypothetical protein GCM10009734_65980 [Nonomuraea bangladeshensis]